MTNPVYGRILRRAMLLARAELNWQFRIPNEIDPWENPVPWWDRLQDTRNELDQAVSRLRDKFIPPEW